MFRPLGVCRLLNCRNHTLLQKIPHTEMINSPSAFMAFHFPVILDSRALVFRPFHAMWSTWDASSPFLPGMLANYTYRKCDRATESHTQSRSRLHCSRRLGMSSPEAVHGRSGSARCRVAVSIRASSSCFQDPPLSADHTRDS